MRMYPYYVYVGNAQQSSEPDENGNYSGVTYAWTLYGRGHDEGNQRGNVRQLPDGTSVQYSSTIYTRKNKLRIPFGTPVIVSHKKLNTQDLTEAFIQSKVESGEIRLFRTAVDYSLSELNTRIWV